MQTCGAETHLFSSHPTIDVSDASARRVWGPCRPASPKDRTQREPQGLSQAQGVPGVDERSTHAAQRKPDGGGTDRHVWKVFVLILPHVCHFGLAFPSQDGPPERKCHLGSGLNQRDQAAATFAPCQSSVAESKKNGWGCSEHICCFPTKMLAPSWCA